MNNNLEDVRALQEENIYLRRKVAELEQNEIQLRKLYRAIEQSPVSIVITDLEGNIEYANPKFSQVTGYTLEEALGQNPRILKSGELSPEGYKELWELVTAGREWYGEFHNKRKDGTLFWEFASISPIFDADGSITHFVAVKEEITERKQMESELQTAYQHLKSLNEHLQDELNVARRIQQNLLPPQTPNFADLDVFCFCAPAYDVGGDFYTYHFFDHDEEKERRYSFAVGDVSGKGMPAALLMAVSLVSFKIIITQAFSFSEVLSDLMTQAYSLNQFLGELDEAISPYTLTTRQNCALAYVEITCLTSDNQQSTTILRSFNAGCIMPLLRHADGSIQWVQAYGLPLGVGLGSEAEYHHVSLMLEEGDMIIMCSDGVVEAMQHTGEMFGFERWEQAVKDGPTTSSEAMIEHLQQVLADFTQGAKQHDDITLVAIRR